ncbi:MAG: STAS domain-containing protein [Blastochloris sp.]|nr:STAS domain-containing protein [Blastochloris sp.]
MPESFFIVTLWKIQQSWFDREGQQGIVRVVGKGSFKNARHLKKYVEKASMAGIHDFTVDLQECIHMDSTFMGVLAGLASERRREKLSLPRVVNINSRNFELLQTLGIDRILPLEASSPSLSNADFTPVDTSNGPADKLETAQTMLDAHQTLIDVNPANAAKFQDVMTFLKDKLNQAEKGS